MTNNPMRPSADPHLEIIRPVPPPARRVCTECVQLATPWVHLRQCLTCGKIGCCDNSPNRHATAHFHEEGHPLIRSAQPGEDWSWCYLDEKAFVLRFD